MSELSEVGGGEAGGTPEKVTGTPPERLTVESLEANIREIMALGYNPLNTSQGTSYMERESEVKELEKKYLESGQHGELFIVKKGEAVAGFLAVRKDISGRVASIEQLRLASMHDQETIQQLLAFAKQYLQGESYLKAHIEATKPNEELKRTLMNQSKLGEYWELSAREAVQPQEGLAA